MNYEQRMIDSCRAAGFTDAQILSLQTTITHTFGVAKIGEADRNDVYLAVAQMVTKGTVERDELCEQAGEAIPGAMAAMAYHFNVESQSIRDMMERREIKADAKTMLGWAGALNLLTTQSASFRPCPQWRGGMPSFYPYGPLTGS